MQATDMPGKGDDFSIPANKTLAIFLVSVLGLFLEMLLIRWIGTEIRIFAYMQNTVLVVCFLGLGLGCLTSQRPISLRRSLIYMTVLTLLLAVPISREALSRISGMLSVLHDSSAVYWTSNPTQGRAETALNLGIGLVMVYLVMSIILRIFVSIGRLLGRLLDEHPNTVYAYSVNIAGSLAGTWLFVLVSYYYLPPVVWTLVVAALMLLFLKKSWPALTINAALLACMVAFSWFAGLQPNSTEVVWSPYQKLALYTVGNPSPAKPIYQINVNNVGYQAMLNLDDTFVRSYPDYFSPELSGFSQYDIPFLLHPGPKSALLVGAGSGNDAAGALRHGVDRITAVDIDPAILSMGRRYHPERPYDSPKVRQVNDDARSFFATCRDKYDVVVFCLLDSHTKTAMTNARLDNYVYTRESLERARGLLADGGIMVLSFEARQPYIADRLAGVLREVFGEEPISFRVPLSEYGFGGAMFVAGDLAAARGRLEENAPLASVIDRWKGERPLNLSYTTRTTEDDWPYVYLEKPSIPTLYYFLGLIMAVLVVQSRRYTDKGTLFSGFDREHWHFFFLGAAFLLLEVQGISKASVVLGNTWEVNAVIVSAVLIMILLANLLAYNLPRLSLGPVYAALCGICLGLYFVDLASFAFLPYATKAVVVGGLTTLPMLFSGIVFIRSFAKSRRKDRALGANIIGALFGALMQSVTFVTGIKFLLLMVAAFYLVAFFTRPEARPEARAAGV